MFVGFVATMGRSDSSCPFIDGVGSTPSRRGPVQPKAARPGLRSPRFRRSPFVRDKVSDLGGASAPRLSVPHILPSTISKASASTISYLSRLNRSPHTIAVYASQRSSPSATQHSLPGGRYPLPGPDFHRLDHASFAWRTDIEMQANICWHVGISGRADAHRTTQNPGIQAAFARAAPRHCCTAPLLHRAGRNDGVDIVRLPPHPHRIRLGVPATRAPPNTIYVSRPGGAARGNACVDIKHMLTNRTSQSI